MPLPRLPACFRRRVCARAALFAQRSALHEGFVQHYATESMAGGLHERGFCAHCGSRLSGGESPTSIGIVAGSLDDPTLFRPTIDIHVADVQPWDLLDPATTKFDGYPI
ncbi:MAG: GFA family protein [Candidatus Cybelea sp.]